MVALVSWWFTLMDMAKTAFLAPFSSPTSQFLDYFHSFFELDPPCLELHAKHQFGEISLFDGHGCPGCPVVFLAGCGKNCIFCTIFFTYKSILGLFSFFFLHEIPLDPEIHAKHQLGEIPLLDGHGCPGCPVVFVAGYGKNCLFWHHFHHLQVNSWTISILLYALDPPCLELHGKHQFREIQLLDGHGCPGCPVVYLA